MALINEYMNSHVYISILDNKLVPFIDALRQDGASDIVFQRDNSGIHTSKLTTAWLTSATQQYSISTIE